MRAVGASVASLLGAIALAVAMIGWMEAARPLTAAEAADAAAAALQEAGVEDAEVGPDPSSGTHQSHTSDEPVDVWQTVATVEGGTLVLWLAKDDGQPVYLDDRSPDGGTRLLTDEQVRVLGEHVDSVTRDHQLRRNLALTTAAGAIVVLAALLATAAPYPNREDAQ